MARAVARAFFAASFLASFAFRSSAFFCAAASFRFRFSSALRACSASRAARCASVSSGGGGGGASSSLLLSSPLLGSHLRLSLVASDWRGGTDSQAHAHCQLR